MNARPELVEIIRHCDPAFLDQWYGPHTDPGDIADEYADTIRTEVLAEVTAWLVKKSREEKSWDAAVLASKVARGAVRPNNLRMLPADFFEPDRTYTEDAPFRAPEDRPNFQCIAVAIHPTTGNRRALGFEQAGAGRPWKSSSMRDEEWADGWTDVTDTTTGDDT